MEALNIVDTSIPVIDISNEFAQTGIGLVDAVEKWGLCSLEEKGWALDPRIFRMPFSWLALKFGQPGNAQVN